MGGQFAGTSDGTVWPRKCASKHELRYSSTLRLCWRQVATTVSIRSTNRLPSALSVPPLIRRQITAWRSAHAPNNVAKTSLIPDSVISRTRLRPKYGQGWQPRLDPLPRQAEGRDLGEKEST